MSSTFKNQSFDQQAYEEQFKAARERVVKTKRQTLEWVSRLDVMAASEFIQIEPMLKLFPRTKGNHLYRLVYEIHTSPKRYGTLGVSLRTDSMRTDLSKLTLGEMTALLKPFCGQLDAKAHSISFQRFKRFNEQVAALRSFGIAINEEKLGGPVLPRWFEAIQAYGLKCSRAVENGFDQFIQQSQALDEAIFDFNSTMGAVRYRSIRCSYTVDDFDLLGPSFPALKVVTSIDPVTRRRRYNLMADFKKSLKKKRMGQKLRRQLGRDPEKSEVLAALNALRPRMETDWITKDVIKACYLGRSIKDVFEVQDNLVTAMQPWTVLRAQLQALLP
jgi:hypothetical protein